MQEASTISWTNNGAFDCQVAVKWAGGESNFTSDSPIYLSSLGIDPGTQVGLIVSAEMGAHIIECPAQLIYEPSAGVAVYAISGTMLNPTCQLQG